MKSFTIADLIKSTNLTERQLRYLLDKYPTIFNTKARYLDENTLYMFLLYSYLLGKGFKKGRVLKFILPRLLSGEACVNYALLIHGDYVGVIEKIEGGIKTLDSQYTYIDYSIIK